jgi:hypothetical protein
MNQLQGVTALTHDQTTGTLYIATGDGNDSIYSVNQASGVVKLVKNVAAQTANLQALDIAPQIASAHGFMPGMIYAINMDGVEGDTNSLWRINRTTGQMTKIATLPTQQLRGLSFNPVTGELWGLDIATHTVMTITVTGQVMPQFTVPVADQYHQTGINTAFSLAHNCTGELFTVDMAYGVLVNLDLATQQGYWVGEYGALANSTTGSFQLQGLDTYSCQ